MEDFAVGRRRGAGLEIFFHAEDVVAQADIAVAAVEERGAVVAGVEGRLAVEDVVDRELHGEAAERGTRVLGAEIVSHIYVVIRL